MPYRPLLSSASVALTREVGAIDERGRVSRIAIPAERPLTVYVDRRELVTLMTLGAAPEALTLGYLRNQRLVRARRPRPAYRKKDRNDRLRPGVGIRRIDG